MYQTSKVLQQNNWNHLEKDSGQQDLQNQQKQISLAFIPDLDKQEAEGRIDLVQEGAQRRATLRILEDGDAQLSPRFQNYNSNKQVSFGINNQQNMNIQNFSKKSQQIKLSEKKAALRNKFVTNKMEHYNRGGDFTPYTNQLEKEHQIDSGNDRQVFQELDEWKNEVDHVKRVQNFTNQFLTQCSFKQDFKNNENISTKNSSHIRENNSNKYSKSQDKKVRRSQIEESNKNINEQVQSMIDNRFKLKDEEHTIPLQNKIQTNNKNIRFYNQKSALKDRILNYGPQLNEQIINNIMKGSDIETSTPLIRNQKQKKTIDEYSPSANSSKHLILNGASPSIQRELKSKFYNQDDSTQKQSTQNISKLATFKQESSKENNLNNQNNSVAEMKKKNETQINENKKTIKQIQSDTNEMLIEKLFLMKLKKKMETINNQQNEQEQNLKKSQVVQQTDQQIQSSIYRNNDYETTSKNKSLVNQEQNTKQQINKIENISQAYSLTSRNGLKIDLTNLDLSKSQNQSRCVTPLHKSESFKPGFLSQRESNTQSTQRFNQKLLQKQQNIVKDVIETFQNKTLESFKFIQEMKRTRTGTPQLLTLVCGKKPGELNNQTKTEKYIQQIEKELFLNSVKKNIKLQKEFDEISKQHILHGQEQTKLLEQYKLTIVKIRDKKDEIEKNRLECFLFQSMINQLQDEKKMIKKRMQEELERITQRQFSTINLGTSSDFKDNQNQKKRGKKYVSQKTIANFNSQVYEQQENIKLDFQNRQRSLSNKIREIKQDIQESNQISNNLQKEMINLKDFKISTKKQLKDQYLSLLQFKSSESPQISIIQLIKYLQEIGEEINEKILPPYFDEHNIAFVKRLQEFSTEFERLQEEMKIVQQFAKNSIHSQIQAQSSQISLHPQLNQSQIEFASQADLMYSQNQSKMISSRKFSQHAIDPKQQSMYISKNNSQQQNYFASQNSAGVFSSQLFSQNQLSLKNCDEEERKLLQMMIGNEINHKKEIKKKLQNLSKNTIQSSSKRTSLYNLYQTPIQEEQSTNQTTQDHNKQDPPQRYSIEKNDDEYYFLLNNIKKGSLQAVDFHKKILEQIEYIQEEMNDLKEQEMDRMVKQYHNISSDDRIQNVKKIFILMYGNIEGVQWFSKFLKKRKDFQQKSQSHKTFNFQEALFSIKNGQNESNISEEELKNVKDSSKGQYKFDNLYEDNSQVISQKQLNEQIKEKMSQERVKVKMHLKRLQDDSNDNAKINQTLNEFNKRNQLFTSNKQSRSSSQKDNSNIQKKDIQQNPYNSQIFQKSLLLQSEISISDYPKLQIQPELPNNLLLRASKSVHFSTEQTEAIQNNKV